MSGATFDKADVDRIKHETDIIDMIRRDVVLTPKFKNQPTKEHFGPCPFCRAGEDRFIVWPVAKPDGTPPMWMCRYCKPDGGSVIDYVMQREGLEFSEAVGLLLDDSGELPVMPIVRPIRSPDKIVAAVEAVDRQITYWQRQRAGLIAELHEHPEVLAVLERDGISEQAAHHFDFGYAVYQDTRSLVLPWRYHYQGREIVKGVQHRAILGDAFPDGDPRYRWLYGSDGKSLFNADAIIDQHDDILIVVEGAKKAASLWSHGMTSVVGIASKTGWDSGWASRMGGFKRVIFALDPDASSEAVAAAKAFPGGAFVADLPMKPDDLLVATRGNVNVLWSYLDCARKVD